jgi:hypothetical protein
MSMEHCWSDSDRRKSNYSERDLSQCCSVTNYTWTVLRCDTCTNKRLGHGTTEDTQLAEEGVMKIMYVSGFQVDCVLCLVRKSFEIT